MKNTVKIIMILLFAFSVKDTVAQKKNNSETIKIKTSAQCEMCKERIEKAMAYEKGIVSAQLDVETAELTIKYKTTKTTPEKIRIAISKTGYDADDIKSDKKEYDRLPRCCQKGGMGH